MLKKSEKGIDNSWAVRYNGKAVLNAAIAQSVERILGKDEVASSNLASSSRKTLCSKEQGVFQLYSPAASYIASQ